MVMTGVGADALDGGLMALLRHADRRLVADDLLAVLAKQAVHVDVAGSDSLNALNERVEHQRMVIEIAGLDELDLGMPGGHLVGLGVDAADQDTREQEVRKHDDPAKAQPGRTVEQGIHARMSDAAVADLNPTEARALPQHARNLGDVAVGVRIGGATTDHGEQGVLARHRPGRARERSLYSFEGGAQQLGIDAEVAPELHRHAVLGGVGIEHRGNVVLDVAGREQHAGHREHVVDAARAQPVEALADDRSRELQEAALERLLWQALAELADQAMELLDRSDAARAMAAYHDAYRGHDRLYPVTVRALDSNPRALAPEANEREAGSCC